MFHLYTVASDESKMTKLYQSAKIADITVNRIEVLHWTGFIDKILLMKQIVDDMDMDDIVCFVDAYDVLVFSDAEEIVRKFRASGKSILLSSELNCYPPENRDRYDLIEYFTFEADEAAGTWGTDKTRCFTTNYKYLNSGGYVGYAGAIKRMFQWKTVDEIREMCLHGGDQNFFTQYYLEYALSPYTKKDPTHHVGSDRFSMETNIGLDSKQEIFQSMYRVNLGDFAFFRGRLYNHVLRTYPCFAHFNGYRDYNGMIINWDNGDEEDAMEVFVYKMKRSRENGNAEMEYRVPNFYYLGVKQECIAQKIG